MGSEDKFWSIFVICSAIVLLTLIIGGYLSYYCVRVEAFKNGYEEVTLPGHSPPAWQKAIK